MAYKESEKILDRFLSRIGKAVVPLVTYPFPFEFIEESRQKIVEILCKALPSQLCFEDEKDFSIWLLEKVPFIQWTHFETLPDCFSIFLICKPVKEVPVEEIFLDHLKNWLNSDAKIPLHSFCHYSFHLEGIQDSVFFIAEARFFIENQGLHHTIQSQLPSWSQELAYFLKNPTYISDFSNIKIIAYPQSPLSFFRLFIALIQKYPNYIEKDIFNELGCFFTQTTSEFRAQRSPQSLIRIVCSNYLLRKQLQRDVVVFPEKRHLCLRFLNAHITSLFGSKKTLGIVLVMHLPGKYEFLDECHILLALQELQPNIQIIKGSSYVSQASQNTIRSLYIEIEKIDGKHFSMEERSKLLAHLQGTLSERVEKLNPSIFMSRNEEEIMKNILLLSRELKIKMDLPQVMISLERQTQEDLFFAVTLVRVLKEHDLHLSDSFTELCDEAHFLPDRRQIVGYLRKKHPKEANVFQLQLPRSSFLRADSSTHFYLARHQIVTLLERVLGPIRDYNGGIILRQGERFLQLKNAFPHVTSEFLENFYYSLTPIEMQILLPFELLKSLFEKILKFIDFYTHKKDDFFYITFQEKEYVCTLLGRGDPELKSLLDGYLNSNNHSTQVCVHFSFPFQETPLLGHIYLCSDQEKQKHFTVTTHQIIEEWKVKKESLRVLRMNFQDWPYSLDPRLGGDTLSTILLKILYEGLTRRGKDGILSLAVAEKVIISKDKKTYTFKLRECYWSNGDKVVAYDFEYAWKKILEPHFTTPFAYLFYPIKNAKAVKEGHLPLDLVKIASPDPATLIVELEAPSSYFLDLLLHPLFSPINHKIDQHYPNWCSQDGSKYVCNGPFHLRKANAQLGRYEIAKNSHYWDANAIDLDEIIMLKANSRVALDMFLKNEIDWLGRPTMPWEASFVKTKNEKVETYNTPGIYWYVFNVQVFPFHNKNVRKAISHSIDRKLLSNLQYGAGSPSITPLPFAHTQHRDKPIPKQNIELARKHFNQALIELGVSHQEFPIITLIHTKGEIRDSIAHLIERQIEEALGIQCKTESYPWDVLFDKMTSGEYQMGAMGWTSTVDDPLYTLNTFKYKTDKINFSKWENLAFQKLLDASEQELDRKKREHYLAEAEAVLIEELPLIPISYEVKQYMKKKHIQLPSETYKGEIDFRWLKICNTHRS